MTVAGDRLPHLQALATRLAAAWQARGAIDDVRPDERPRSRQEAYAVQDRMAAAIGDRITGWKVGATSRRMRALDGHDDVIPGRLLARATFIGPVQRLDSRHFPAARMEAEFAFRLSADLPVQAAPRTVAEIAPIIALHPAIEIIGDRYPKGEGAIRPDTLLTVADNGGGMGFVAGAPAPAWRDLDFRQHHVALATDGGPESESFLGEMRCEPLEAMTDLANALSARGIALHAGDFVSTGAAAVPIPLRPGTRVVADFGRLGRIELEIT